MAEEKPLGDTIRDARVALGLSLRDLAKALQKTPSYLSDIENNRRVPAEPVLRELAGRLDLDYDDLMARAGRIGEDAVRYMMRTPAAGVLMRKLSDVNAPPDFVEKLTKLTDQAAGEKTDANEEPKK